MDLREIKDNQKSAYNKLASHVIQSFEWGEFRQTSHLPLLRYGLYKNNKLLKAFQLTLHKIPFTDKFVGYLPKGPVPDKEFILVLKKIAKENNIAFIKLEPNTEDKFNYKQLGLLKSPKPLFTKYNFVLDLTPNEETLLKNMHPKTRYNIKVAQKHGVKVAEKIDDESFKIYLKLYFDTTKRQGYHGHNSFYHKQVWDILRKNKMARILIAYYKNTPLTAWMLLNFKDTLYYPYGGSSKMHPEVMANNLIAWEAIKLGKKLNLKKFDMWGALGPDANPKDPWFGFHRFKQGFGGKLVAYAGSFDLVLDMPIYLFFTAIDKLTFLKIFLLKILKK